MVSSNPYNDLAFVARAVVLRVYPMPPTLEIPRSEIPTSWLQEAALWLSKGPADMVHVGRSTAGNGFTISGADALSFLGQARAARAETAIVAAGGPGTRVRAVNGCFRSFQPNLALAAGGPSSTDRQLLSYWTGLRKIVDRLASGAEAGSLAYAFLTLEPDFRAFVEPRHRTQWSETAGEMLEEMEELCDEFVPEAFPCQVLGQGHLRRLGKRTRPTAAYSGGLFTLQIGDPSDWLLNWTLVGKSRDPWLRLSSLRSNTRIQGVARRRLRPCLLTRGEGARFREQRFLRSP